MQDQQNRMYIYKYRLYNCHGFQSEELCETSNDWSLCMQWDICDTAWKSVWILASADDNSITRSSWKQQNECDVLKQGYV